MRLIKFLSVVLLCAITHQLTAQQGINYKALIKDGGGNVVANQTIDIRFTIIADTGPTNVYQETHTGATTDANGIVIVNLGEGTPNLNTFTDMDWGSDGHSLKVELDIEQDASFVDMGTTPFLAVPYALHANNVTGLEKITENAQTGWRLIGRNPDNFGDIGTNAIDLSDSDTASTSFGATGEQAFATGRNTTASGLYSTAMGLGTTASGSGSTAMGNSTTAFGEYSTSMGFGTTASGSDSTAMGNQTTASGSGSTAMGFGTTASGSVSTAIGHGSLARSYRETAIGSYNTDYTPVSTTQFNSADRLLVIGNGTGSNAKSDALIVLKDGTITAPSFSTAAIDAAGNTALVTKEYADANYTDTGVAPTGLEQITENGQTGWRLIGRNPDSFGDIGTNAIDLSANGTASTSFGATGEHAFATGRKTTASGIRSTAMGEFTEASGDYSTALGNDTTASGNNSTAMGIGTTASGLSATAMGFETTASGENSTAMGDSTEASNHSSTAMGASTTASGGASTAMGNTTIASGNFSTAMGLFCEASGLASTAMGSGTTASGDSSTAIGEGSLARSYRETALGSYNTNYTPISTINFNGADRLFVIGNGLDGSNRSNALIILKNGTITAPSFSTAEIDAAGNTALVTKEYADANYNASSINDLTDAKSDVDGSNNGSSVYLGIGSGTNDDATDNRNVGVGLVSLQNNSTGEENNAIGHAALVANTTGSRNTAMGKSALVSNTVGNDNTAIGANALTSSSVGSNNIGIGSNAQVPNGASSNQVRIGNTSITYAGVQVAWDITSDRRWKDNIRQLPYGLDMVKQLNPVDYVRKNNEQRTREIGFIGQEVETLLTDLGYDDQGLLHKDDKGFISLRYNDFIAILTKAIQEQQEIIENQNNQLQQQDSEIKELMAWKEKVDQILGVN